MNTQKLSLSICILFCFMTSLKAQEVQPILNFDLSKYLGEWHEIASIPVSFQKQCYRETKAEYSKSGNNQILVVNSCKKENGDLKDVEGLARKNPKYDLDSQLQVSFVKILNKPIWMFGGNYWVLAIGENYEYSLVGEPNRKYAWILARNTKLEMNILSQLHDTLKNQGYDPCQLLMSRTIDIDFEEKPTLCDYIKQL